MPLPASSRKLAHFFSLFILFAGLHLGVGLAHSAPPVSSELAPGKMAENSQLLQDIASAGRVRLQAQRLAKLYQQSAMGLNPAQTARQMKQASSELDNELGRLSRYSKKSHIQRNLARNETLWRELRESLHKASPSPAGSERIYQLADELMLHSGKLVMQIETEAETPLGRLLDLSSRLNMLAQRLARLYLEAQAGNKSSGLLIDVEQARKEFAAGLKELETAPENSQASRESISLAKNQWIFFDLAISQLKQANQNTQAILHVISSSERIAQVLDAASSQYVKDYTEGRQSRS